MRSAVTKWCWSCFVCRQHRNTEIHQILTEKITSCNQLDLETLRFLTNYLLKNLPQTLSPGTLIWWRRLYRTHPLHMSSSIIAMPKIEQHKDRKEKEVSADWECLEKMVSGYRPYTKLKMTSNEESNHYHHMSVRQLSCVGARNMQIYDWIGRFEDFPMT